MSRYFDAPLSTDSISLSPGTATFSAPFTVAALIRPATGFASLTCYIVSGNDAGGSMVWGMVTDTGQVFTAGDFNGGPTLTAGNWYWVVVSKASGSVLPRWSLHNLTAGSAWAHTNGGANVSDVSGPVTSIIVGNSAAAGAGDFYGEMAAVAVWGSALSDGAVEAACTLSAGDLLAASPAWMIRLNQASTGTAVSDDTGNGGNQTAISGTAVDADEPPGWSYTLTSPETNYARPYTRPTPGRGGPTGRLVRQIPGPAWPAPAAMLGAADETDTALSVSGARLRTAAPATGTDTALSVGRRKTRAVGVPAATDSALPLGRAKTAVVGVATEADAALAITVPVVSRHNLSPNPACGSNVTGWGGGSTPTRATGLTGLPVATGALYTANGFAQTPAGAASPAATYTGSVYVQNNTGVSLGTKTIYLVFVRSVGGDDFSSTASFALPTGVTRVDVTAVAPANTTGVYVLVDSFNAALGSGVNITACLLEQVGTLGAYFDGDSPGARWDGTADNSTSSFGPLGATIVTATEADTAQSAGRLKVKSIGIASGTDAGLSLTRAKSRAGGPAGETDAAQSVGTASATVQRYAGPYTGPTPGWVSPTGWLTPALAGSAVIGNVTTRAAGIAGEADTAQSLARAKARAASSATEVDSMVAVGRVKVRAIALAATTDVAVVAGRAKRRLLGVAGDAELARPVATPGQLIGSAGTTTEADSAVPVGRLKQRTGAVATTVEVAFAVGRRKARAAGTATEADSARPVLSSSGAASGPATGARLRLLGRGRRAAEAGMTDSCAVRRRSGTAYDDETGTTTPTWTAVYAGRCRMKEPSARASRVTVGQAEVLLQQPELHLPMSAALLRPGDEATITVSASDPGSVGRVLIIRAVPAHSQATARRYGVTERTS